MHRPQFLPIIMLMLLAAGCSSRPAITTATVGEHVSREEVPYQKAQERSYFDYFADLRHRLDRLDKRLDVLQTDIAELQTSKRGFTDDEQDRMAGNSREIANAHDMVMREKLSHSEQPIALTPNSAPNSAPKATSVKPSSKPVSKPAIKQTVVKTVPASKPAVTTASNTVSGKLAVTGLRISEDANRTRIVFDTTAKASLSSDLDNNEKLLVVTLPKTAWSAAAAQKFTSLKRLSAYQVMPGTGSDAQLVFTLKQAVSLGNTESLPPSGGHGHRVYIDLK